MSLGPSQDTEARRRRLASAIAPYELAATTCSLSPEESSHTRFLRKSGVIHIHRLSGGCASARSAARLLIAGREYRGAVHAVQPSASIGSLYVRQPSGDPTSVLLGRVGFEAKLSVDLVSNTVKRRVLEVVMLIIRMCDQNPP